MADTASTQDPRSPGRAAESGVTWVGAPPATATPGGGSPVYAQTRGIPAPPSEDEQSKWTQEATQKGLTGRAAYDYVQKQWMADREISEADLAEVGQVFPGYTEETVPGIVAPTGATPGQLTAAGVPGSYSKGGVTYYAPGSTMYEKGFRTSREYDQAQAYGTEFGPHGGKNVPPGTTVVTNVRGKPVLRVTRSRIEQAYESAGIGENEDSVIVGFMQRGQYRIPVTDVTGSRELLLTKKQVDQLEAARASKNPEEYLRVAVKLGIAPAGSNVVDMGGGRLGFLSAEAVMAEQQAQKEAQASITARAKEEIEPEDMRPVTLLKDGTYIYTSALEAIREDTPLLYDALLAKGYEATMGEINRQKTENPKEYFLSMQTYGMVPDKSIYYGTLPDGTVQYISAPDVTDKTGMEIAKEYGELVAEMLIPGVWLKDLNIGEDNQMPLWQIGLNTGLDLLILVPVAGWGARLGGKAILKAGTKTLATTLAKELPQALVKVGERQLARESVAISKNVRRIDKLMARLEKAATATAKAEKSGNLGRFVKAVQKESLAKTNYAQAMRNFGVDIAVLNSKLSSTPIKAISKKGLGKAVGMASKADSFANYVAGVQKEIVRANLAKSFPKKVSTRLASHIKAYASIPKTIGEVSVATAKSVKGGTKAGAAYLRGEGKAFKVGKGRLPAMNERELQNTLSRLERTLAKESAAGQARVARYKGRTKTLDRWDDFIKEDWSPGGRMMPQRGLPVKGGGVATISTIATTPEMAAKYAGGALTASYRVPIKTLAGKILFTILVNPDGTTEVIRTPGAIADVELASATPIIAPTPTTPSKPRVAPTPTIITSPSLAPAPAPAPAFAPAPAPAFAPAPAPAFAPAPAPSPAPAPAPAPAPVPSPALAPAPPPPPFPSPPPPIGIIELSGGGRAVSKKVPNGSIAWAQGALKQGPQWYYIPPPYTQRTPISLSAPPTGARNTNSLSPYETIQIIGQAEALVPPRVDVDLGFADITIVNGTKIIFRSGGEDTNIGSRLDSNTKGMDLGNGDYVYPRRTVKKKVNRRKSKNDFSDIVSMKGVRL